MSRAVHHQPGRAWGAVVACGILVVGFVQPSATAQAPAEAALMRAEPALATALAEAGAPGAAVAVVAGDRVVWTRGFGVANTETGAAVTPDTLFQIGSATKMFTAAAILSAASTGAVALDRPVSTYVSGLAPASAHRR